MRRVTVLQLKVNTETIPVIPEIRAQFDVRPDHTKSAIRYLVADCAVAYLAGDRDIAWFQNLRIARNPLVS